MSPAYQSSQIHQRLYRLFAIPLLLSCKWYQQARVTEIYKSRHPSVRNDHLPYILLFFFSSFIFFYSHIYTLLGCQFFLYFYLSPRLSVLLSFFPFPYESFQLFSTAIDLSVFLLSEYLICSAFFGVCFSSS